MAFKTFLLATSAAVVIVGPAKAADLAIAVAPVDYVTVCDAFGAGFFSVPGTDTCLQIDGYARLDFTLYSTDRVGNIVGLGATDSPGARFLPVAPAEDDYAASWDFESRAEVDITAQTMTDIGPVLAVLQIRADSDNDTEAGFYKWAYIHEAYGAIGPALFGFAQSTFDGNGALTINAMPDGTGTDSGMRSDVQIDQFRLSSPPGKWGVMLGFEDPRGRYDGNPKNATGDFPDAVLALTATMGGLDWKLSGAATDRTSGVGWAVQLNAGGTLGKVSVQGNLAYSDNAPSYVGIANCSGTCPNEGSAWSGFLSAMLPVMRNVDAAATLSYADFPRAAPVEDIWGAAVGAYWHPTATAEVGLELEYAQPQGQDDIWQVLTRFEADFQ